MRIMYDSTSPWDIPSNAEVVAGYVDGRYAWPQSWWDLFPNAVHVKISAIGRNTAPVGDVEVGCIWPVENAVDWVLRARADGYDPTIYVNQQNDWAPCRAAFQRRGVAEPHWWVAKYDGVRVIPDGAVGKQFAHPHDKDYDGKRSLRRWETGKHFDLSVVADYWPGIDNKEDDMNPDQFLDTRIQVYRPDGSVEKDESLRNILGWSDAQHKNTRENEAATRTAIQELKWLVEELGRKVDNITNAGDADKVAELAKQKVVDDLND